MNLQEVWKKLELEKLEVAQPSLLNPWATKSKHPVAKLKQAYQITTIFALVFLIAFFVLLFVFDQWVVKIGLLATIAGYIFFFVTNFSMYRKIKTELPLDGSVKQALQSTYEFITSNIRFQERTALFIYPVAAAAGYVMGAAMEGADAWEFVQKPIALWVLLGAVIISTPLGWLLTRWMYRVSYGVCLAQLRALINELEQPS
jgi:hypothetical protein